MRAFIALFLLVVGLAVPAPAVAQSGFSGSLFRNGPPPWAVEAPGSAGARYGLGLDVFFEQQESLRITFNEQRIASGEQSETVRTDPGLLNRKFNLRWDLNGTGIQPAIALPLPRTLGIYPTLVIQAAVADIGIDFRDRNRPEDSSSLKGRGPLFGTGLDLTRPLCRSCSWFAGAGYFFQKISGVTVDRSPVFRPEGFDVLEDRVRLDRDVHAVSTRVGYGFPGSRVISYVGALHRWNDVKIDDRLRYRDSFQTETSLASRTRLESEVTLAVAGVEARLGSRLFGRLEASVGGGDRGGMVRVVYLPGGAAPVTPPPPEPEQPSREETARIAGRLQEIRREFAGAVESLGDVVALETLLELLNRFEKEVLGTLPYPEYAAMRDLVNLHFQQARDRLKQGSPAGRMPSPFHAVPATFNPHLSSRIEPAALILAEVRTKTEASRIFGPLLDFVDLMWKRFNTSDIVVNPCVKTNPVQGARIDLHPLSYKGDTVTTNKHKKLRRGYYAYHASKKGYAEIECPKGRMENCLDLLTPDRPIIVCTLSRSQNDREALCTADEETDGQRECESP